MFGSLVPYQCGEIAIDVFGGRGGGIIRKMSVYQRITENNDIITDFWTDNLLELILRKDNLNKAYRKSLLVLYMDCEDSSVYVD